MELQKSTHVVLLASPGLGHLIPTIELGKRFILHHNFKATILAVTSTTSPAESHILKSTIAPCHLLKIPSPDISTLVDADAAVVTQLCVMMREAKPAIRSALSNMTLRPSALIVDMFGTESLSIAREFNISNYVYVASHAWVLSLLVYSPVLDQQIKGQYVEQSEKLKIPGCNPIRPEEVVDPMLDRNNLQYKEYLGFTNRIVNANGLLVNTWEELQRKDLEALRNGELKLKMKVPDVYAIGPLVRSHVTETSQLSELLVKWLDEQPDESVVYVSFGSGGTLSYEQMTELAWGLELSEQRFVWVVRTPMEGVADLAFFTSGCGANHEELSKYLPEGFMRRTQGVGLLVPQWTPQVTVLMHRSVGGFISHCGWGSVLESITNGVPMIAWPLYAEQKMNATLLTEELGVAVRPAALPTKKVVYREEIAQMVRQVVIGEGENAKSKIRDRMKEIQRSGVTALSIGGSSYVALSQVAKAIQGSTEV